MCASFLVNICCYNLFLWFGQVTLPDDNNKEKEAIVLSGADCNLGIDVLLSALREGWFSATSYRILISMMLARRRDKGNPIETLLKYVLNI